MLNFCSDFPVKYSRLEQWIELILLFNGHLIVLSSIKNIKTKYILNTILPALLKDQKLFIIGTSIKSQLIVAVSQLWKISRRATVVFFSVNKQYRAIWKTFLFIHLSEKAGLSSRYTLILSVHPWLHFTARATFLYFNVNWQHAARYLSKRPTDLADMQF